MNFKKMHSRLIKVLLFFAFHGLLACAENDKIHTDLPEISEIKNQIQFLASDELMGREVGTDGCKRAAAFIAGKFNEFGLRPIEEFAGFYQKVPFENVNPPQAARLEFGPFKFKLNENLLQIAGSALRTSANYVFLEYGADEDELIRHAVRDKIVITKIGSSAVSGREAFRFSPEKRKILSQAGARALIEIPSSFFAWNRLQRYFNHRRTNLRQSKTITELPHFYIDGLDGKLAKYFSENASGQISLNTTGSVRHVFESGNVAGVVPGTDSDKQDEYIVLCAHYDHIGAGLAKRGATPADSIFNGARDNGMGVTALLAAAKYIARNPLQRPVIFLALTAEEKGLFGSKYFVENSPVPLAQIVFVLNSDGAGVTDESIVTVIGHKKTNATAAIEQGIHKSGLTAIADPVPAMHLFERSDNISFARRGIPAITISPGFRHFEGKLTKTYHRPNDEIGADFPFEYLYKFCAAFVFAAEKVGNLDAPPEWSSGEKYAETAKRLYHR